MTMRKQGLTLVLSAVGDGRVVTSLPPESLISPGEVLVQAPNSPATPNVILHRGYARARFGYSAFTSAHFASTATRNVTGLFNAIWDDGTNELILATQNDIFKIVATVWTSIEETGGGAYAIPGDVGDQWTFAMMRASGTGTPHNELHCCNGVSRVLVYTKGISSIIDLDGGAYDAGSNPTGIGFSGAKVLMPQRGRAIAMNVLDASGNRRHQRVMYSVVGDPRDYHGTGSGYVDLDDDPYPIVAGANIGGRVVVYKGNEFGGSIVVGTPTGVSLSPYRWDTIAGVGILAPRTLRVINDAQAFFLAHDGFYLHDGARGLLQVGDEISRDLLRRFSVNSRQAALTFYIPEEKLLYVGLPLDESAVPSEWWIFDTVSRRFSGPTRFAHTIWQATRYGADSGITWHTAAPPWDTSWDALPYSSWDTIAVAAQQARIVLADFVGNLLQMDLTARTDAGAAIAARWTSPTFTPFFQSMPRGRVPRIVGPSDVLALRTVALRYANTPVAWKPIVYVSADGGSTWTRFSNDTLVGDAVPARYPNTSLKVISYENGTGLPGERFILRVDGDGNMALRDVVCEFCYAGDRRNA